MGRALAIALLLAGCTAGEALGRGGAALEERPVLVAVGPASQGPQASDAVPAREVAFRMPDGSMRSVDRLAIAFVPRWRDGAALVDRERRLYEVRPDGQRRMLARGATGALAVSDDGSTLAYVIAPGVLGELRTSDGRTERVIARDLASIGTLRIAGDEVAFVGATPGGIAGVWVASVYEARCYTNCELRTGTEWQHLFMPPPIDASSFEVTRDVVSWMAPNGIRAEVTR